MTKTVLYHAVWRWHFYAGVITLPFPILLAVTGACYLFKDEINEWRYADWLFVNAAGTAPLSPSAIVANAVAGGDREVTGYLAPAEGPAPASRPLPGRKRSGGKRRIGSAFLTPLASNPGTENGELRMRPAGLALHSATGVSGASKSGCECQVPLLSRW